MTTEKEQAEDETFTAVIAQLKLMLVDADYSDPYVQGFLRAKGKIEHLYGAVKWDRKKSCRVE